MQYLPVFSYCYLFTFQEHGHLSLIWYERVLLVMSVLFQVVDHLIRESHFLKLYSWTWYLHIRLYQLD